MKTQTPRVLSSNEAARLLYRTAHPSAEQVMQVEMKLAAGALRGQRSRKGWQTTTANVAEYLADSSLRQQDESTLRRRRQSSGASAAAEAAARAPHKPQQQDQLRGVYTDVMRDYFLALIFRRRQRQMTQAFERAVVAGQVGLLLLFAAFVVFSVRPLLEPPPPEQQFVHQWIEQTNGDDYTIERWYPPRPNPEGPGQLLRVEYRYKSGSRGMVQTQRDFLMTGSQVTPIDTED